MLLKVFRDQSYVESFLDGNLYMNTLQYFKGYEETEINNIGDRYEGVSVNIPPKNSLIYIKYRNEVHTINPNDIVGSVTIQPDKYNTANVFCLYGPAMDVSKKYTSQEVDNLIYLDEQCLSLGEYLVVIHNSTEFVKRIENAASKANFILHHSSVEYYDSELSFAFKDEQVPFRKTKEFGHQKEYRFVLLRDNPENKPYILEIGDIRDIASTIPTKDFNSSLSYHTIEDEAQSSPLDE